ncbi:MAG TPA: GNAT family N-acetyltransferase [Vicinamibacterales bacterium]|nr:GNAT family N-acetyltransferase [Vicinamibacterales bacterium]
MSDVRIRVAVLSDAPALGQMRAALWPDGTIDHHTREIAALLEGRALLTMPWAHFIAVDAAGDAIGFVEVDLRSHANGCDPAQPVGFIEGWYVVDAHRGRGVGRQLVSAAEAWAREHGCREMASDTQVENDLSQRAHEALGYMVVDRCVNYRKAL